MNREQVLQMLSILKAAYPHSFQKLGKRDADALVALWERQFAGEEPEAVSAAIDSLIATRTAGYSPTIGEIKEQIYRLRCKDQYSEVDAWTLVERACRNGIHHAQEEFDRLPPDIQEAVGGPEQLKAWAMMDAEIVNSVIASNFRKSYSIAQERAKHIAMLPANIREMLSDIAEKVNIERTDAPALKAAKIEPMMQSVKPLQKELPKQAPVYAPPCTEEWEKLRAAAMEQMDRAIKESDPPHKN